MPNAVWAYNDPQTQLNVTYRCLRGYQYSTGPLVRRCNLDTERWVPDTKLVCKGNSQKKKKKKKNLCISMMIAIGTFTVPLVSRKSYLPMYMYFS